MQNQPKSAVGWVWAGLGWAELKAGVGVAWADSIIEEPSANYPIIIDDFGVILFTPTVGSEKEVRREGSSP